MLPCVRSCTGKKLNRLSIACADTRPGEPLLFLYPAWFRAVAQHADCVQQNRYASSSSRSVKDERVNGVTLPKHNSARTSSRANGPSEKQHGKTWKEDTHGPQRASRNRQEPSLRPSTRRASDWQHLDQGSHESKSYDPIARITRRAKSQHSGNRYRPKSVDGLALAQEFGVVESTDHALRSSIVLPSPVLKWFTGTGEENCWKHHDGSGCVIHVLPSVNKDGQTQEVELIGTPRAREIAQQHLDQLCQNYHERQQHDPKADIIDTRKRMPPTWIRVDHIPRPEKWSVLSFLQYVETIVTAQAPYAIERILYPREENYNNIVAKILMEIFDDRNLWSCQSSFALRRVLEFCSTRTDIAFAARSVWAAVQRAGIIPDIACFNFEIARCLRVGNTTGVVRLIREMREAHVHPNGATWALLYGTLHRRADRARFLQLPIVQHSTYDQSLRDLSMRAFVDEVFKPSDDNPSTLWNFCRKMSNRFGKNWLTTSIVTTLIERCIKIGSPSTISEVLKLVAKHPLELDEGTFNVLLKAIGDTAWYEDVLSLLKIRMASGSESLLLDQRHVEQVFRQAWKLRLMNTCRVLWRYAASHGFITHQMLQTVSNAITQNNHPDTGLKHNATAWMAAIAIHADSGPASDDFHEARGDDLGSLTQAVVSLSQWAPCGQERHRQMQIAHKLLECEMTAWQRLSSMKGHALLDSLETAFEMDTVWHKQDVLSSNDLPSLLERAITIQLEPAKLQKGLKLETTSQSPPTTVTFEGKALSVPHKYNSGRFDESSSQRSDDVSMWTHTHGSELSCEPEASVMTFDELPTSDLVGSEVIAGRGMAHVLGASTSFVDILMRRLGLAGHDE